MDELHIFSSLIHHMLNLWCWSSYGPLAFFTRCLVCRTWSKRSFSSNVLIKSNLCLSCPRPLVKIIIPLGQCEYFNQVGPSKKSHFFVVIQLVPCLMSRWYQCIQFNSMLNYLQWYALQIFIKSMQKCLWTLLATQLIKK
jgi:hypothetical protein